MAALQCYSMLTHQHSQIGLRSSTYHVGDKAFVAWCIQNGKVLFLGLEVCTSNLHSFPFVSLFLICVKSPGEVPENKHYYENPTTY